MSEMKTLTEKRFFEWHEDDVSVTLRNKGGSYGGGSEVLIVNELSRNNRSANGKQPSRQLLRSGCIQRNVGGG